jgi:hypothetical protein
VYAVSWRRGGEGVIWHSVQCDFQENSWSRMKLRGVINPVESSPP